MLRSLRSRLLLGIAPLFGIMVALGLWAVVMFYRLGGNIDVILRENYKSVLAAQTMKEAIERMDSALLFAIGGQEQRARDQFREYRPIFEKNLAIEQGNITLPGEQQLADDLTSLFHRYIEQNDRYFALAPTDVEGRTRFYFSEMLPTFSRIKDRADDVLNLNQRNMEEMDLRARTAAASAVRWMTLALVGAAVIAALIALVLSRSILVPIRAVTHGARAMARGDLEQVVPVLSRDELGELADAFNAMARRIREFQQAGTARLLRAQKTAQATIDSFPDPVIVVDPAGAVERANPSARRLLGVPAVIGETTPWKPPGPLVSRLSDVLHGDADYLPTSFDHTIGVRENGHEHHLLPRILAIRDASDGMLGAAVVLTDVTRFRLMDQLKSDMVSTVSHELKTPLTSIQMAIHLLLEEVVGPITPKQAELLLAARQDSDRLLAMVNDLLDLARIEQGRVQLDLRPIPVGQLVQGALMRFEERAEDAGIKLKASVPGGLPPVFADEDRVSHVFDNLLANALAHTDRGGRVTVSAELDQRAIRFSVADTGEGIAAEHLPHIFGRFYRVPGSRAPHGVGLGLAITREIVEAHGGQVDVTSRVREGTTFTFTLPTPADAERAGETAS